MQLPGGLQFYFGKSSFIPISRDNNSYYKNDIFEAARLLYGYDDDLYDLDDDILDDGIPDYDYPSVYGAFDVKAVHAVVSSLSRLAYEADYLWNRIRDNEISVDWAYAKSKELQAEWNESGFPINERNDTSNSWKTFSGAISSIKSKVK